MSITLDIDEDGLEISNESLLVRINSDLSFTVFPAAGDPWAGADIRDLIDVAKLVEPELIARYGGYK